MTRAYHTEIPNSGDTFMIESSLGRNVMLCYLIERLVGDTNFDQLHHGVIQKLEIIAPYLDRLPTLLDDKYMLEFLNALSEKHMIAIYARLFIFSKFV